MKTKNAIKYIAVVAVLAFIYPACKKDRIQDENKSLNNYDSPNTYLDSKKQAEQEFTIDSTGSGPIVGNQGTNIWPDRQCLMYPNGDTIAFPFTLKLVELYTPKDMIYYQMPTIASDTILESDGEIRLRAFKNGTELVLKPGCSMPIKMPNTAPKNYMRVFYGTSASAYWTDNPASLGITTSYVPVFATAPGFYVSSVVKLGWVNCDFKHGASNNHHLTFVSSTDILTNVAIFVYFPATKTVMQVYNSVSGSIPDGSNVKIVAIGVNGSGQLYSFSQTQTVNADAQIQVTMAATSDAALTTLLNGL